MTPKQIETAVPRCLKSGKWMLRRSNNGKSHGGFKWKPIGQWTEAPDWNPSPKCGGGLHGNDQHTTDCFWSDGTRFEFCEYDESVRIDGDAGKIKVRRARILMVDALPDIKNFAGWLYLSGCTGLTSLPEGLSVGGSLYLSGCTGLTSLPEGLSVGGWLDLRGCTVKVPDRLQDKVIF